MEENIGITNMASTTYNSPHKEKKLVNSELLHHFTTWDTVLSLLAKR